jgi:hypothetical protein
LTLDRTPGFTLAGMTNALHIPARPDAPIACDMRGADDTPDERLAEYGRLFENALARRVRHEDGVAFAFRADPGTRATVESVAQREAACCPFLEYRVQTVDDEIRFEVSRPVTGPTRRAGVDAILDAFYTLPDHAGAGMAGLLARLADNGVDVVETAGGRFRWSDTGARAAG